MNLLPPRHLGDSVYANTSKQGWVVLTTDNHNPSEAGNVIVLEPEVVLALLAYLNEATNTKT